MRYYIIAGEASGDLHGSNLIKAIKAKDNNAVIQCWGGDLMEAAGGKLVKHYRALAFMGFVEVIMNLRTILSNIQFCKKDIEAFQPDVLICIDYPGFNLRIAEWAKQKGIKVIYFIAHKYGHGKKIVYLLCVKILIDYFAFFLLRKLILKTDGIGK
jgi:lipid-A-disaccharide synthase